MSGALTFLCHDTCHAEVVGLATTHGVKRTLFAVKVAVFSQGSPVVSYVLPRRYSAFVRLMAEASRTPRFAGSELPTLPALARRTKRTLLLGRDASELEACVAALGKVLSAMLFLDPHVSSNCLRRFLDLEVQKEDEADGEDEASCKEPASALTTLGDEGESDGADDIDNTCVSSEFLHHCVSSGFQTPLQQGSETR